MVYRQLLSIRFSVSASQHQLLSISIRMDSSDLCVSSYSHPEIDNIDLNLPFAPHLASARTLIIESFFHNSNNACCDAITMSKLSSEQQKLITSSVEEVTKFIRDNLRNEDFMEKLYNFFEFESNGGPSTSIHSKWLGYDATSKILLGARSEMYSHGEYVGYLADSLTCAVRRHASSVDELVKFWNDPYTVEVFNDLKKFHKAEDFTRFFAFCGSDKIEIQQMARNMITKIFA